MTLPDGAALGTTTDPKALIKGEPGQVESNATALSDESTRVTGLSHRVDAVSIEGWAGGFGQPAYAATRTAEQAKWRAYADLLKKAGSSLSTYAGALRTAQGKAADAIAKWQQGEEATAAAVRDYNNAVDAYNAYQNRCVAVPSYGGSTVPSMGPARPGPFHDPGEALRHEAQQILDDARETLDGAGATAVKELGGLEGSKTEGSSGPSAGGSVKGPSFSWGDWEDTFGKDPTKGKGGKYDGHKPETPFKINLGEVEGHAKAWGAEGSWEDYWGDVKVHADGSVTMLGVEGKADAHIGTDGLVAGAHGKAVLVGAEGSAGGEWGYAEAEAKGEAYAGANADGELGVGPSGVHASGELFAGAKAEGSVSGDVAGIGGEVKGEAWAGVGASGDVDFGFDDGKLTVGGSGGLALGVGGKVGGEVTLDFDEVLDAGSDVVHGVGELFK